jgi:hypothetical protein
MSTVSLRCLILFSVLATLTTPPAQAQEIFTATAVQGDGVALRSVPVVFVIDRYMTDGEHAAAVAALQEGPEALHRLLASSPDIGRIIVAEKTTPLKYVYRRPQSLSRIALLANEPLAFLDPGAGQDKSTSGFDFTLVTMDLSLPGFGSGEIDPAVKIEVNSNGQIETREYGAVVVRLSDVRKK